MAGNIKRKIVLADGTEYYGEGFGGEEEKVCEVLFSTSMIGLQELLTDPVYSGKMVVLTYPVAGCCGINDDDNQSRSLSVGALVVRDCCDEPSNFRCTETIDELLSDNRCPGISGVDTRALTRKLREGGTLAIITAADTTTETALESIRAFSPEQRPAALVSCKKRWYLRPSKPEFNVAVIDCGARSSDLRCLKQLGCDLTILPFNTTPEQLSAIKPDGLYISDGPGNPELLHETIELISKLRGKLPICGEGLGFQLICLACGGSVSRLSCGVYGGNHPIREIKSGKIAVCAQSRDFGVLSDSLKTAELTMTHTDVCDGSVQGAENKKDRIFGVQYISGGEDESFKTLFSRLKDCMREVRTNA